MSVLVSLKHRSCPAAREMFGKFIPEAAAPFLAASLSGGLLVGLVSSVTDTPRVAFLFWLLALFALALTRQAADAQSTGAHPPR